MDDLQSPLSDNSTNDQSVPLAEDNDTPAAPADSSGTSLSDQPQTDSNQDAHQVYDEGTVTSSDAEQKSADNDAINDLN